jgi:hypothetical protein
MSIILGISSLSSKLGKIQKKIVRMVAIFKMSAKTHQNFKVRVSLKSIGQKIKILERLQHISDGQTIGRMPGISISSSALLCGGQKYGNIRREIIYQIYVILHNFITLIFTVPIVD